MTTPNVHKRCQVTPGLGKARYIFTRYRGDAARSGREWEIEFEDFVHLVTQDCYLCGAKPSQTTKHKNYREEFYYNGLDRVDSSRGYFLSNVKSCCKVCNKIKNHFPLNQLLNHLVKIINHTRRHRETA